MRISLIAAVGLAAGLLSGPVFAAQHHRHHYRHHHTGMASRQGEMNEGASQNSEVDQLNNQSLQAARQGQNYTPPGTMGGGMRGGGGMQPGMSGGGMMNGQ
jgi:hypothetical protein